MDKKIIFFTGSMGRGGAEKVISLLSEYYYKIGWKVVIGMVLHDYIGYQLSDGIRVVNLSSEKGIKRDPVHVLKNIRKFVKKEKPDVIVSFMAQVCLLVGVALLGKRERIIMSERIDPSQVKRNIVYKCVLNYLYKNADAVIFQTKRAQNYFGKKIRNNSCIIANPIRVTAEALENSSNKIVTAGRLVPQKNHKMLIDAFAKVVGKYPEYRLEIFGDGELKEELEKHIANISLQEKIILRGNVLELHQNMADAKIFVLSSDFEGLSNALLEAMMMGLPCISTACAGSDEMIVDGENGLLVPVRDTAALSEAMLRIIEDDKGAKILRKNAKASLEQCKVDKIIKQWSDVIEGRNRL